MRRHVLLLECGHWTYESTPDWFDPTAPANAVRVCTAMVPETLRPADHSFRYRRSEQGLPLVPVSHIVPDPRSVVACTACPADCNSCSHDRSCCECYEHDEPDA